MMKNDLNGKTAGEELGFARPDYLRAKRCGWPEVIYGGGKTAEQIVPIFRKLLESQREGEGLPVYATRVDEDKAALILREMPELQYDREARIVYDHKPESGRGMVGCAVPVPPTCR